MLRTFVSGLFGRAPRSTSRKALVSRLALESLETREVPAADTWLGGSLGASTSWSLGRPPATGDDVIFSGTSSANSNASLALPGSPLFLNSIQLINGYSGTVSMASGGSLTLNELIVTSGSVMTASPLSVTTLTVSGGSTLNTSPVTAGTVTETGGLITLNGAPLTTTALNLSGGTIDQSATNSDITVNGAVTWTGGTLNGTPDDANVFFNGGGTISLANGGTTGDTLNFGDSNASATTPAITNVSGAGSLVLDGTNPAGAIFVNGNAAVINNVTQQASLNFIGGPTLGNNTLNIAAKSYWGYTGNGTGEVDLQVINNGGKFFVGTVDTLGNNVGLSTVNLVVKPSQGAAVWGYTQTNASAVLEINSGNTLDVTNTKGATVSQGSISLTPNTNLAGAGQTSTLAGNLTFTGGTIGFPRSPVLIGDTNWFVLFRVTKNVTWSGGTYVPGIDGKGLKAANQWAIMGTLTVNANANPQNNPTVVPAVQFINPKVTPVPNATWASITAVGGITGTPGISTTDANYTLDPQKNAAGTVTGFNIVVNNS